MGKTVNPPRFARLCARLGFFLGFGVFADVQTLHAEPLRLRADAVAEAKAPAGLVMLQGEDRLTPWLGAEALVWTGAPRVPRNDPTADVMVLVVRMREPHGLGEARAGRFVFTTGAIRPVHLDGVTVLGRAPWGSTVEAAAGTPVAPSLAPHGYDWLAGGRFGQTIASRAAVGISYVQRRERNELGEEEAGADVTAAPAKWLDLGARGAYDLVSPGIADARASIAARSEPLRVELFGVHRSPSRLLPATSLFSVLGDFPSEASGASLRLRAAPRLDLFASGAAQAVGRELGGNGSARALLRLDDAGEGNLGLELRRQDVFRAKWSGIRGLAAQPLGAGFRFSTEIEVAVPDHPEGRGTFWPWALVALGWRSASGWEAAGAVEAASTPVHRFETNALLRVARTLEVR